MKVTLSGAVAAAVGLWFAYSLYELSTLLFPRFRFHDERGQPVPAYEPVWRDTDELVIRLALEVRQPGSLRPLVQELATTRVSASAEEERVVELSAATLGARAYRVLTRNGTASVRAEALHGPRNRSLTVASAPLVSVRCASSPTSLAPPSRPRRPQHRPVKPWQAKRNLIEHPFAPPAALAEQAARSRDGRVESHIRREIHVGPVIGVGPVPVDQVPPLLARYLRRSTRGYVPPLLVDASGISADAFSPLNASVDAVNVTVRFSPVSFSRWTVTQVLLQSLEAQRRMGAADRDLEDVRSMFLDNHPAVLLVTLAVTVLHVIFDVLAFKNDIQFWRNASSFRGISVNAMTTSLACDAIIFLYLVDEDTSLLVLAPAGLGLLVSAWKLWRATSAHLKWEGGLPRLRAPGHKSLRDSRTSEYDRVATSYMALLLTPPVVGLCIHSLVYQEHVGWYNWALSSAVAGVYAFGFALMTPQLYVNMKLRSVAHLPWRVLMYRSFNTFIDDLFAFVIRMPTLHRISTLRDDVVFLAYLYQRWIYPKDETRTDGPDGLQVAPATGAKEK